MRIFPEGCIIMQDNIFKHYFPFFDFSTIEIFITTLLTILLIKFLKKTVKLKQVQRQVSFNKTSRWDYALLFSWPLSLESEDSAFYTL